MSKTATEKDLKTLVLDLRDKGLSIKKIAKELHVRDRKVSAIVKAAGGKTVSKDGKSAPKVIKEVKTASSTKQKAQKAPKTPSKTSAKKPSASSDKPKKAQGKGKSAPKTAKKGESHKTVVSSGGVMVISIPKLSVIKAAVEHITSVISSISPLLDNAECGDCSKCGSRRCDRE